MIGAPVNDHDCLGRLTEYVRALVGRPEFVAAARPYSSLAVLVEDIRRRPQINDVGKTPPGVPVIACPDVPQRTIVNSPMPNCWERAATFVLFAELIDPSGLYQLATLDTPAGRHTIALRNGSWVVLDPYVPEPSSTLFPARNGMASMGTPRNLALPTATASDAQQLLSWLVNVAESVAAQHYDPTFHLAIAHARYVLARFGLLVGEVVTVDSCSRIPGEAHDCSLTLEDVQRGTPPDGQRARRDLFALLPFSYYGALNGWGVQGVAAWQQAVYLLMTLGLVGNRQRNADVWDRDPADVIGHGLFDALKKLRESFPAPSTDKPRKSSGSSEILDPYASAPAPSRKPLPDILDPYPSTPARSRSSEILDPYPDAPKPSPAPRSAMTIDDLFQPAPMKSREQLQREQEEREGDVALMRALDWIEEQQRKHKRNCGCSSGAGLRNVSGQDVFEVFHQVGKAVLSVFGLGAIGDLVGKGESAIGIRPKGVGTGSLGEAFAGLAKGKGGGASAPSTSTASTSGPSTAAGGAPGGSGGGGDLVDDATLAALLRQPNVAKLVQQTGAHLDAPTLSRLLNDKSILNRITGADGKIDPAKVNSLLDSPLVASVVAGRLKQLRNTAPTGRAPATGGALLTVDSLGG